MEKNIKINLLENTNNKNKKNTTSNLPNTNSKFSENEKLNLFGMQKKPKKPKEVSQIDLNYIKPDRVLNFYKFKNTNSKITCHGRPTIKQVRSMKNMYHVNYCLTLQKLRENPHDIEKYCIDNTIPWQLIELDGANAAYLRKKDVMNNIVEGLVILCKKIIEEKLVLFIHCAAGLHRTGTVLYTLLRTFGETPESAMSAIKIIRVETHREVGKERVRIAETMLYPELVKRLKKNGIELNYSCEKNGIDYDKENENNDLEKFKKNEIEIDLINRDKKLIGNIESEIDLIEINDFKDVNNDNNITDY